MRRFALFATMPLAFFFAFTAIHAQPKPEWLIKEFSKSPVSVAEVQSFLVETCQTSSLDGIQLLAVQSGHNKTMNLHVYCRPDKHPGVRYKVSVVPIPDRNPDKAAKPYLGDPDSRVGPFYFGNDGEPDGFVLVQIIK